MVEVRPDCVSPGGVVVLAGGEVDKLLLVLVDVDHVAGLRGRSVGARVLPLYLGIKLGLTKAGAVALMAAPAPQLT